MIRIGICDDLVEQLQIQEDKAVVGRWTEEKRRSPASFWITKCTLQSRIRQRCLKKKKML